MERTPIGDQQIKGLRLRDLITIIACTISIVTTVMISYFNLKSDIAINLQSNVTDGRLFELRISTMEANLKALQTQIDALRTDIYINRKSIENK